MSSPQMTRMFGFFASAMCLLRYELVSVPFVAQDPSSHCPWPLLRRAVLLPFFRAACDIPCPMSEGSTGSGQRRHPLTFARDPLDAYARLRTSAAPDRRRTRDLARSAIGVKRHEPSGPPCPSTAWRDQ